MGTNTQCFNHYLLVFKDEALHDLINLIWGGEPMEDDYYLLINLTCLQSWHS